MPQKTRESAKKERGFRSANNRGDKAGEATKSDRKKNHAQLINGKRKAVTSSHRRNHPRGKISEETGHLSFSQLSTVGGRQLCAKKREKVAQRLKEGKKGGDYRGVGQKKKWKIGPLGGKDRKTRKGILQ